MLTEGSIEIDAPADVVWEIFADVERWPTWTASMTRIVPLDGPGLAVGKRFEITQPKFPKLVWTVTALEPGRSWTWVQRSPGGTTTAVHDVVSLDGGRTLVRQQLDQRGPIGTVVGFLVRRLTRTYLDLEARGLKAVAERRRYGAAA